MALPLSLTCDSVGVVVGRRPTTLSARAAEGLASGPLDAMTLMRDVCKVQRLQRDAAENMAIALLSSHDEFVHLPSGHWALREPAFSTSRTTSVAEGTATPYVVPGLSSVSFAVVDVETTG